MTNWISKEDNEYIEDLLKEYLDIETPTQSRLEESLIMAKIEEAISILDEAVQPIKDGKSFGEFQVKSDIFDAVNKVDEIVREVNSILLKKHC